MIINTSRMSEGSKKTPLEYNSGHYYKGKPILNINKREQNLKLKGRQTVY